MRLFRWGPRGPRAYGLRPRLLFLLLYNPAPNYFISRPSPIWQRPGLVHLITVFSFCVLLLRLLLLLLPFCLGGGGGFSPDFRFSVDQTNSYVVVMSGI